MLSLTSKKNIARLAGQLRKVTHFYTGDVDFSIYEQYQSDFNALNIARQQVETILKEGKDSKGDINKDEYEKQLETLNERIIELNGRYESDTEAQSQRELKAELEGLALLELASDEKFLSPIFKELGIEVEYGTMETAKKITETIHDFFLRMK